MQPKSTSSSATVGFAFSPCYLCELVYAITIILSPDGNSNAGLKVNGNNAITGAQFPYTLLNDNPAKFLVQTFPLRAGKFRIKAEYIANENVTLFDYNTTIGSADGLAPFGITYAVFGNNDTSSAATYSFNDGKYICKSISNVFKFNPVIIIFKCFLNV